MTGQPAVVVTSFGSDGDLNPLLAIAAALVRRNLSVTFVANPFYECRVLATGSRFVPAGQFLDVFAALAANPGYFSAASGFMAIWRDLIVPSIRETFPVVRDAVHATGATVVVAHLASFGGAWAAAAAGVRSVTITTASAGWLSRYHPIVFANWRAPRPLQSMLTVAMRTFIGASLGPKLRRLAISMDAPLIDTLRTANLNLGVWPEWFRAPASDDPPRTQLCGFVYADPATSPPLSSEVAAFLADSDAPIVAAFGSAASLHAVDRYRAIANACAQLGRRCLLIGSSANVAPASNLLAVASAPYASVFPAAAAIIHHGGFGTCAEALRAGRPSLVTPFAFDQFDTAARLEDAGLGRWYRHKPDDAAALAAALDSILHDAPMAAAARDTAAKIASAPDGADYAAELIAAL
ncbi:MAG TPA: glycosyltransferase [Candidatus Binataceae bacterium]|nr:glycosyltransferase [Candidatus Binataceae bacterium]